MFLVSSGSNEKLFDPFAANSPQKSNHYHYKLLSSVWIPQKEFVQQENSIWK